MNLDEIKEFLSVQSRLDELKATYRATKELDHQEGAARAEGDLARGTRTERIPGRAAQRQARPHGRLPGQADRRRPALPGAVCPRWTDDLTSWSDGCPSGRWHVRALPPLLRSTAPCSGRRRGDRSGPGRRPCRSWHARRRRDPPRRGHRPRHRVVPQRSLARLQDRTRDRPRAAVPVRDPRGGARRAGGRRSGRWSSSKPTMRWPRPPRWRR